MLWLIFKRCVAGLLAYLTAVATFFPVFALLCGVVSLLEPEAGKWTIFAVSPVLLISAPVLGLFAAISAITLTALPAVFFVVVAETFALRHAVPYLAAGALGGIVSFWSIHPLIVTAADLVRFDTLIIALAGLFSGLVFWALFGRYAGNWRPPA